MSVCVCAYACNNRIVYECHHHRHTAYRHNLVRAFLASLISSLATSSCFTRLNFFGSCQHDPTAQLD